MSGNIRLPNITGKTVEEQAQQMKSYLTQLAGELNWALDNMNGATGGGSLPYRSVNTGMAGSDVQKKAEELLKNFNDIKGLIIKSADIVNAYYEEINTRLSGLYVAQSEYGAFVEKTNSATTQNSTNINTNYTNIQLVTGRVEKAEGDIVSTREDLTGIIEQTDTSLRKVIGQTEQSLQGAISQTDSNLREVIGQTEQSLQKAIDDQDKALRETIGQVDTNLQQVVTETENRLAGAVTETEEALQKTINQAKQDMLDDIDSAEQRMTDNISSVEQNLTNNMSDTRSALENSITDAKDLADKNIANAKDDLGQNIANAKSDLQDGIDKAREELSDSIKDTEDALENKISDTKGDLEKSISEAEDRLKELLNSSNAILVEVFAHINSGLLYYDDNGIPIYGLEVGQRTLVNGQEVFNKYARFTANKLSFYDQNGTEVAYISDKKLYITYVEITVSLTQGGFVDTVMANKSIVTKWIGGG